MPAVAWKSLPQADLFLSSSESDLPFARWRGMEGK